MPETQRLLVDISAIRPIHPTAEFPTEAARDAYKYTQADVGKVIKVDMPSKYWLIVSVSHHVATFRELAPDAISITVEASDVDNDSSVAGATVKDALESLSTRVSAEGVASGINNDSGVGGASVKDALNTLSGLIGIGGGAVSSVFGRTGTVTAHNGDYTAAQVGAVPVSRSLFAGMGLLGGGDLSLDRSFAVDFGTGAHKVCEGNDARLNDARTPLAHALSHKPGGADALATGPASSLTVGGANAEGTAAAFARQDHIHALPPFGESAGSFCEGDDVRLSDARTPLAHALSHKPGGADALATGPASSLTVGGANAEGTAASYARQDHVHALPPFGESAGSFCEGNDVRLNDARAPLAHALSHQPGGADALATGPASSLTVGGANAEGTAASYARQDHVHALPPFGESSGSFCEGDDARLSDARTPLAHAASHQPGGADGLPTGPASSLTVGGANAEGTAAAYTRQDHVHALPPFGASAGSFCEGSDARLSDSRTPLAHAASHQPGGIDGLSTGPASSLTVGGANAEGTASAYARQDHVHALPAFGTGSGSFCQGNDVRLNDARTPLSHALSHLPGGADEIATAVPLAVGSANQSGSANSLSRSDHVHDASALLPRDGSRAMSAALDAGGNNLTNIGAIFAAPTAFAWSAGAASIDVSAKNDFVASNLLTANSTLTLSGGSDGCQGTVYVKQDASGGRTLGFTIAGRTILREAGAMDSNPQPTANTVTGYSYDFKTIGGTAYVIIERFFLT